MTSSPQDGSSAKTPASGSSPHARTPAATVRRPGELVARLEQLGRQKPPPPAGRKIVMIVLGVLAGAGAIHTLVFGGPVGRRLAQQIEERERSATPAPREPGPVASPGPEPAPAPPPPHAPGGLRAGEEPPTVEVDSAGALAMAALHAAPDKRAARRLVALETCAQLAELAAHRRAAIDAALRLTNEATPEEAPIWARITDQAVAALDAPGDAGIALLYLVTLRDRAGPAGLQALERVVADERRPLEQRCTAARALPEAARVPLLARVSSRPAAHPELLRALR